jgi:hypothetical protein
MSKSLLLVLCALWIQGIPRTDGPTGFVSLAFVLLGILAWAFEK